MRSFNHTLHVMRPFNHIVPTDGSGHWSRCIRQVKVIRLEFDDFSDLEDDARYGELRVYFDPHSWDVDQHGLIYTDKLFKVELFKQLALAGYRVERVGYSEQGMQGDNYVSFDVSVEFITSWEKIHE